MRRTYITAAMKQQLLSAIVFEINFAFISERLRIHERAVVSLFSRRFSRVGVYI